jgi:uncharacterized membrane protein YfcA
MLGYALATLIGLSLGVMGGGGSILTVPILVYVLGMDAKLSIALSLAIVGTTSLVGVFNHFRAGNVNLKVAAIFGPVAMVGTFLGAKISRLMSGEAQLILFAIIMLMASYFMIKGRKETEADENKKLNIPLLCGQAVVVGIITGLVGVGGGFMIVPALVLLTGLSMKVAVGTSLFIIALNSFSGFAGYLGMFDIDWAFLAKFSGASIVGILIGSQLVQFISQRMLKKSFGVFLIFMGAFILYKNSHVFVS